MLVEHGVVYPPFSLLDSGTINETGTERIPRWLAQITCTFSIIFGHLPPAVDWARIDEPWRAACDGVISDASVLGRLALGDSPGR